MLKEFQLIRVTSIILGKRKRKSILVARMFYRPNRFSLYKFSHLILKTESFKVIIQKGALLMFAKKIKFLKNKMYLLIFQRITIKRIKRILEFKKNL